MIQYLKKHLDLSKRFSLSFSSHIRLKKKQVGQTWIQTRRLKMMETEPHLGTLMDNSLTF